MDVPVPPFAKGKIPVIFEASTSVTFESVMAPAAIFAVVTALSVMVKAVDPVTSPVWVALVTNPLYKLFTALSPVLVPDKLATAPFANMALLMTPLEIEVALPVLVTTPVKFALVVTVAAFPVTFPVTFPTIPLLKVLTPANVWAVLVTIPGLVASAGAKFNTPLVMVAPFSTALKPTDPTVVETETVVEPRATQSAPL